jgi:O-antigen/teichoic acid export membrane protein
VVNSATLFGAASSILIARYLGAERMGEVSYAIWLSSLLSLFSTLGLPTTIIKYVSEYIGRESLDAAGALFRRVFRLECLAASAVLFLFLAEELAFDFFEARGLLVEVGIYFLTLAGLAVLMAAAQGMKQFKALALLGAFVYPVQLGALWLVLALGGEIRGVLWVYVAANAASMVFLAAALRKGRVLLRPSAAPVPAKPPETASASSSPDWKRIGLYFLTVSGITLIDAVVWQRSEVFFLKKFSTDENVAFYSIGFGLSQTIIRSVGLALLGILMPYFSSHYGANDMDRVRRLYDSSTRWLGFFTIPFIAAGVTLGPEIIRILYGKQYLPVNGVLWLLLISSAAGTIAGGGAALLHGVERQMVILKIGAAMAVLNLLLDIVLIPSYGLMGAAAANAASQIFASVLGIGYIVRSMKIKFPTLSVLKTLLSSAITLTLMLAAKRLVPGPYAGAAVAAALGPLVFLACQKLFAFYSPDDTRILENACGFLPARLQGCAKRLVGRLS